MSVNAEGKMFLNLEFCTSQTISREGDIFKHVRAQTIYHPQTSSERITQAKQRESK